jgi:tetratricopeptide (TPR) repeat protein
VHYLLGNALRARGDVDGAIAQLRHAVRLNPHHAEAHTNLGNALVARGDVNEAADCFREAIRLNPKLGMAHYNLGNVARLAGDLNSAVAAYREAVKWQPDHAEAHCNLGHTLRDRGEFAEALERLRRGHELGSGKPGWRYPSARWVSECAELVRQDARLAAVLTGTVKVENATELLTFARICGYRKKYADAVRFYERAFAKDPRLAAQLRSGARSAAAADAVLAATESGAARTDGERAALRRRALDWLRADLAGWAKVLKETNPAARTAAHRAMTDWLADRSFARVRHPFLLAALSTDEAKAWLALWAEVRSLRDRTAPPPTAPFPKVKSAPLARG